MNNHEKTLPEGWSVISSEYLHKEPWLTVRRDAVKIKSGHIIPKYFVLEYPDWINIIAITTDNKFIVVRQFRYGIGEAHYELCAGVSDPTDATLMDAAKRELLEETGYGGGNWREWMRTAPNPATSTNWAVTFLATDLERVADATPELSEELSVHLFSFSEVREMMNNGSIIQATHLAPLWKYVVAHLSR